MVHELARWQLPLRMVVYGALVTGLAGCVAGLVIGLFAYAPTAWFATFEVGIPAAIIGSILGLVVGSLIVAVRTIRRRLFRWAASCDRILSCKNAEPAILEPFMTAA